MMRGQFKRWRLADPGDETETRRLAESLRLHPLVGRLLWQRGIHSPSAAERFMQPRLANLYDPVGLPGCEAAAQRIVEAIKNREPIVIYGDYDVDGVTATAILFHTLRAAAPDADVRRYIPHRIDEGYGLNTDALGSMIEQGVKLIVTVDCGIAAIEPAQLIAESDADLIITDHHEIGTTLPEACAIVHPRLHTADDTIETPYPFDALCGAGVAYKLAWQFARTWCGSERVTEVFRDLLAGDLLALAALGTVADIVPLVDENRAIVHFGLGCIKRTHIPGLNALIDASNLREEKVDAYHVGFVLGPRLNACGRMGHAISACKLLTTAIGDEAREIAEFLNRANDQRRSTERTIFQEAAERVKQADYDAADRRAIVLADTEWHPGVIGIVCSRLAERFGRPTVILNTANGLAVGSARSVEGVNLYEALDACSEHLVSFGGHAMAAGLKIEPANIDAFRDALVAHINDQLPATELVPAIDVHAELPLADATRGLAESLEILAPFGPDNPQPVWLVREATIAQPPRILGKDGRHLKVTLEQNDRHLPCVIWNQGSYADAFAPGRKLDAVIKLKANRWNNRVTGEGEMIDFNLEKTD